MKTQISLFKGESYFGNAVYWINKLDIINEDEIALKSIVLNRPDSVYVFRLFDAISKNFTHDNCNLKFTEALKNNDTNETLFYHFLLFCIDKNKSTFNARLQLLNDRKINPYSEFNTFLFTSVNAKNFSKYDRLLETYFAAGDFNSCSSLENYLSSNPEYEKLTAAKMYHLYRKNKFYYQQNIYAVKLLKLFNLKENLSLVDINIRESLYPLAYFELIKENAEKYNLDPLIILSIIRAESAYKSSAVSVSNAKGLMQLMDATSEDISIKLKKKDYNVFSEADNICFGTFYFSWLQEYFSGDIVHSLGAYNAGIGNMKKWKSNFETADKDIFIEKIPFSETRNYILKIQKYRSVYEKIY